jgi:hypothetical protein
MSSLASKERERTIMLWVERTGDYLTVAYLRALSSVMPTSGLSVASLRVHKQSHFRTY